MDAGPDVGLGHLIRSIAIAQELRENYNETKICFLTKDNQFSTDLLRQNKFQYILQGKRLEENFIVETIQNTSADILFIDKLFPYLSVFIQEIQKNIRVCMFHNLCDGAFECDQFILPASHVSDKIIKDKRWVMGKVKLFEGFSYIVLNDNILKLKRKSNINADPMHIILTTGGSDPKGVMIQLLKYLEGYEVTGNIKITALIGQYFSHYVELENLRNKLSNIVNFKSFNYSDLAEADLAINTFGVSTYELIYLGIPTVTIGHAKSNAHGSHILAKNFGFTYDLGLFYDLNQQHFLNTLNTLITNQKELKEMQQKSSGIIDGLGVQRVAKLIYNLGVT